MAVKVCGEHGPSPCSCHPDATHSHYRSGSKVNGTSWHEYQGHAHDILVAADERTTYCTHDGCDYSGTYNPIPRTIRWPR